MKINLEHSVNAQEIIDLLEGGSDDRRSLKERISTEAPLDAITTAMREARVPLTRQILCDIAGARRAEEAIPELLLALDDTHPAVRSAAADALGAIRDPKTGPALLEQYRIESDPDVRVMLAVALGAVDHHPAVPDLVAALDDPNRTLQIEAASSLGELHATEARDQIARVLSRQTTNWSRKLVEDALDKLDH